LQTKDIRADAETACSLHEHQGSNIAAIYRPGFQTNSTVEPHLGLTIYFI